MFSGYPGGGLPMATEGPARVAQASLKTASRGTSHRNVLSYLRPCALLQGITENLGDRAFVPPELPPTTQDWMGGRGRTGPARRAKRMKKRTDSHNQGIAATQSCGIANRRLRTRSCFESPLRSSDGTSNLSSQFCLPRRRMLPLTIDALSFC